MKFEEPNKNQGKIDLSKIECYHCDNMRRYKNQCMDYPEKKKRGRDQATIATHDNPLKKFKTKDSEIKELLY